MYEASPFHFVKKAFVSVWLKKAAFLALLSAAGRVKTMGHAMPRIRPAGRGGSSNNGLADVGRCSGFPYPLGNGLKRFIRYKAYFR